MTPFEGHGHPRTECVLTGQPVVITSLYFASQVIIALSSGDPAELVSLTGNPTITQGVGSEVERTSERPARYLRRLVIDPGAHSSIGKVVVPLSPYCNTAPPIIFLATTAGRYRQ